MGDIVDGINTEGLYCGYLYLPSLTEFPKYKPDNPNKVISYVNLSAYFLGKCDSVESAINKLKDLQVLGSTISIAGVFPLHLVLADKSGDSALIEYNGKVKIYRNGENDIDLNVVTNSPIYSWQVEDYKEKSKDFVQENTDVKWDDLYMNGSGFAGSDDNDSGGLAGDWTSPSRFNRATAILNYGPEPKTLSQAFVVAQQAINSVSVPLGLNSAPTNWISMTNLKDGKYFIKSLQTVMASTEAVGGNDIKVIVPKTRSPLTYKEYSVQDYTAPKFIRMCNTQITRPTVEVDYEKAYKKMLAGGAKPGSKYEVKFISLLHTGKVSEPAMEETNL